MNHIGKRLRKLRKSVGLTQVELGKRIGIHPVSIAQYETGARNPSEKTAEKIRAFFNEAAGSPYKPAPTMPKKRGRPKKERIDSEIAPARKRGRPRKENPDLSPNLDEGPKAKPTKERSAKSDGQAIRKTPVHFGAVSRAWLEAQVEIHVHTRGWIAIDGPARVACLRWADLIDLCRMIVAVGGVRVEEGEAHV